MNEYRVRNVLESDNALLRKLAHDCPPLDLHTQYTYWVQSKFFADTCFILMHEEEPVGFITAIYNETNIFIWQIGILSAHQGNGLSAMLIDNVFKAALQKRFCSLSLSIAEDNIPSYKSFESYCNNNGFDLNRVEVLEIKDELDPDFLEAEILYTVQLKQA